MKKFAISLVLSLTLTGVFAGSASTAAQNEYSGYGDGPDMTGAVAVTVGARQPAIFGPLFCSVFKNLC